VDEVTVAEFESDLKNNLYKIWNRLCSGTYFDELLEPFRAEHAVPRGTMMPARPADTRYWWHDPHWLESSRTACCSGD
jgi:hypothetical protein